MFIMSCQSSGHNLLLGSTTFSLKSELMIMACKAICTYHFNFIISILAHSLCSGHRDLLALSWATKVIPSQDLCLHVLHWKSILGFYWTGIPLTLYVLTECHLFRGASLATRVIILLSHFHLTPLFYSISSAFGISHYLFSFFNYVYLLLSPPIRR